MYIGAYGFADWVFDDEKNSTNTVKPQPKKLPSEMEVMDNQKISHKRDYPGQGGQMLGFSAYPHLMKIFKRVIYYCQRLEY